MLNQFEPLLSHVRNINFVLIFWKKSTVNLMYTKAESMKKIIIIIIALVVKTTVIAQANAVASNESNMAYQNAELLTIINNPKLTEHEHAEIKVKETITKTIVTSTNFRSNSKTKKSNVNVTKEGSWNYTH